MGNIISVATDKKMYTKIEQGKSYMASKNYLISKRKKSNLFFEVGASTMHWKCI
jgi:hypothetical protein